MNIVLPPEGVDAAAGHAHIPQQLLQDGIAPDDLYPGGVLGAAHGIEQGPGLARLPGGAVNRRQLQHLFLGHPGDRGHHLRGVPGIEILHELEDAPGVGQGGIGDRLFVRVHLVAPGSRIIGPLRLVKTGKKAVMEGEIFIDDKGGVGIVGHVLFMVQVVLYDVVDQSPHQGDVGAGSQAHVEIGLGRRTGEAGVDDDEFGPLVHGLGDPFETDGMVFRRVAADDHDAVTVGEIVPVVGHGPSSESGPQRGHRGRVSEPGLVLQIDHAQASHQFADEVALLVVEGRPADGGQGLGAVDRRPGGRFADKGGVPGGLDALGQGLHGPVQGFFFPVIGPRGPVAHLLQAPGAGDHLEDRLAFAAQGPLVDGVVGIAFNVDEFAPPGIGNETAADAAKGADGGGDLSVFGLGGMHGAGPPGARQDNAREAHRGNAASQTLDKCSAGNPHISPLVGFVEFRNESGRISSLINLVSP